MRAEQNTQANDETSPLRWVDEQPFSAHFDDVYFSKENGMAESIYVFWHGNQLGKRLREHASQKTFVIVETGFGTGLNFLTTAALWRDLPEPKPRLYFLSVEKYPLAHTDVSRALDAWRASLPDLDEFLDQYPLPSPQPGFHEIRLADGKISLGLVVGDALDDLPGYSFQADAWYLDGFAPARNPQMWQDALFALMAERSRASATFATFTAAGAVRRGLAAHGFTVSKVKGFGRKRDMLTGYLADDTEQDGQSALPSPDQYPNQSPYQSSFHRSYFSKRAAKWIQQSPTPASNATAASEGHYEPSAVIVGGGLSGVFTALALTQRGVRVTLLESNSMLLGSASGQAQLALYAKLPAKPSREARFILQAQQFSFAFLNYWQAQFAGDRFWHPCGLIQLAYNDKERARIESIVANYQKARFLMRSIGTQDSCGMSGIDVDVGGLWMHESGWFDPQVFRQSVTEAALFDCQFGASVDTVARDKDGRWQACTRTGDQFTADHLILANAHDAQRLLDPRCLPTRPLRGQVSVIETNYVTAPKTVLCGEGYLCPSKDGQAYFGATYDLHATHTDLQEKDDLENAEQIRNWLPGWLPSERDAGLVRSASAGLRCTTPDYHPIIGPAPNTEAFLEQFSDLRTDAKAGTNRYGTFHPNLYLHVGHGSKGLMAAPLGAAHLSALIAGTPTPCNAELMEMTSPARFLIRNLRRNRL